MSRKLFFLLFISFSALNGCLYSCNYAPEAQSFKSTDPCTPNQDAQFISFQNVQATSGGINISAVLSLPCQGAGEGKSTTTFTLTFYDANNFDQPPDLTHAVYSEWSTMPRPSCDASQNATIIDKINQGGGGLRAISNGVSIVLGVGAVYPNRLYPYYVKVPMGNTLGQGNSSKNECVNGADMSPFVADPEVLSPVYQKGTPISVETGAVTLAMFDRVLVTLGAPMLTYATKHISNTGLRSDPGQSAKGSSLTFNVRMKPGRFYVVWSVVPNPMAALNGDFTQTGAQIFSSGAPNGTVDYSTDCSHDVRCQGRATAVTVS